MENLNQYSTDGNWKKFLIQDPFGVREVIQPVVSIPEDGCRIRGLGTCFQISPWLWLTANHVVFDSSASNFPEGEIGAVGFSPGLVYGQPSLRIGETFGKILQIARFTIEDEADEQFLPGPSKPDFCIDLAALRVDKSNISRNTLVSPLPIASSPPKIGQKVFAVGFPILGTEFEFKNANVIFQERMFGAGGQIVKIFPNGTTSTKSWPTIQVEGDWESGMSGGPVINLEGQVVGVVSSSFAATENDPGVGFAVDLSAVPLNLIAPELDLENPGFVRGFAVFREGGIKGFFANEEIAVQYLDSNPGGEIRRVSCNPKTEDWISIDS